MKIVFSNKKSGHIICEKIIEYLSKKQKITLEEKGTFYQMDQGFHYPNNELDYFFIEVFDKKMKKVNLLLQFWLGARPDHINCEGNIQASLNDSIEFFDDETITCNDEKGEQRWTIKENTYTHNIIGGRGGSIL